MFGPLHDLKMLREWTWAESVPDPETERDLRALHYFHDRMLFSNLNSDWSLQGCSFSQRGNQVLLVVKSAHEGTPYVAYVTERTTTRCIRIFARQWLEGRVKWHKDKYRQT